MGTTTDLARLEREAVLAPAARELIVATGADRIRFLHGLVTGKVAGTTIPRRWRPDGPSAFSSTAITATSWPWYSRTPITSRPKRRR